MDKRNELIEKARNLAETAHSEQRYGNEPYTKHLTDVQRVLVRFGFEEGLAENDSFVEAVICAAWLHDVVEDTSIKLETIRQEFGDAIADAVWRVTDERGESREARKKLTYPKIRGHAIATIVKLADRIANIEASLKGSPEMLQKYLAEYPGFKAGVRSPQIADPMWLHLERILQI